MTIIDLNSDMGELPELLADGTQEKIMAVISSVNICCGAHAGDDATLIATLAAAKKHNLAIGAHPSYPDRPNFGRKVMSLSTTDLADSIYEQLRHLASLAHPLGVQLTHIKPHGALYHQVACTPPTAEAFYQAVSRFSKDLFIIGLANSPGLELAAARNLRTAAEGFIDRAYEANGSLRPRTAPGSLITDRSAAMAQALNIVLHHQATSATIPISLTVQTLCIHSDTPGSAGLATFVAGELRSAGVRIQGLRPISPPAK